MGWCLAVSAFLLGSSAYLLNGTWHQRWANPAGNAVLGDALKAAIRSADAALYQAKARGRDQTILAAALEPEPGWPDRPGAAAAEGQQR
jgi:hypothetical protein